ncbi:MAG: hypothetical protein JWO95_2468 [Verrucomicrobiales bacterium]|nr:hypothetical protein [Verrucomicrobiales bacterium]
MQNDWASENLQIIRTLMERSAMYRRALAPLTIAIGVTGVLAAVVAHAMDLETPRAFVSFWLVVSVLCLFEAFVLVRRQALKDREPLWSSPTRRVTQAIAPPLFAGLLLSLPIVFFNTEGWFLITLLIPAWMILYGCALHSAGFFMPRGIKLFGWSFILVGCAAAVIEIFVQNHIIVKANWAMGICFGGGHLAYGIYLYFTERRNAE